MHPSILHHSCASSFKGALLINPFDTEQVARTIEIALNLSSTSKQLRHHQLSRYVSRYTASLWSARMLVMLQTAIQTVRLYNKLEMLDTSQLLSHYERSTSRRLIVLDYDGTLVSFQSLAELAKPGQGVLQCLIDLASDPQNIVYIVSGRHRECLAVRVLLLFVAGVNIYIYMKILNIYLNTYEYT